jgi:hypothetical protein
MQLGYPCPPLTNPADHLMDLITLRPPGSAMALAPLATSTDGQQLLPPPPPSTVGGCSIAGEHIGPEQLMEVDLLPDPAALRAYFEGAKVWKMQHCMPPK